MDRVKWLSVAPRDKTIMWLDSVIWHLVTRMEIIWIITDILTLLPICYILSF